MINEIEGMLNPENPSKILAEVPYLDGFSNPQSEIKQLDNGKEMNIFPTDVEWKKAVSVSSAFSHQSSDELTSQANSNISNRKTEATASQMTNTFTRRDSAQDSFCFYGEEAAFQASQPWEANKNTWRATEPNIINHQTKTPFSEGLLLKAMSQQDEIQLQIKLENTLFQKQSEGDLNGIMLASGGEQQQVIETKDFQQSENVNTIEIFENNFKTEKKSEQQSNIIEQINQKQSDQQNECIRQVSLIEQELKIDSSASEDITNNHNNTGPFKNEIPSDASTNNNIQEMSDGNEERNDHINNNNNHTYLNQHKNLHFLEDTRINAQQQEKNQMKPSGGFRSGSSGSSSDDPDIIRPVGSRFNVHVESSGDECGLSSTSKKQRKYQQFEKFKQVTFMEIWQRVKTMDLSKEKHQMTLKREKEHQKTQGVFNRLFTRCSPSTSILRQLPNLAIRQERDHILAFASLPFNPADNMHMCTAKTIYCTLRNTDYCPHKGPHWLSIGFRYQSPSQNFEISKIFGALQILAFLFCYKEYLIDAMAYIDSLDKKNDEAKNNVCPPSCSHSGMSSQNSKNPVTQTCCNQHTGEFKGPQKSINLCVILQDISKQVLVWLEKGDLNHFINIEKSAISVVNKIYFSTFFLLFERFKRENAGFLSIAIAYKTTIEWVSNNLAQTLDLFKKQISVYYKNRD